MVTDQRPDNLPPFFFELTHDQRMHFSCASMARSMIELCYT